VKSGALVSTLRAAKEGAADRVAGLRQRQSPALIVGEQRGDAAAQHVLVDETPIRIGGRGKPARNPDALCGELPDHLSQRRVLPADQRDILATGLFKPYDVRGGRLHPVYSTACS